MLFACERWPNADQLYGFSAECGLKAVMVELGMPVDETGAPTLEKHRKHVHELWPEFAQFVNGPAQGAWFRDFPGGEPFRDWRHHDRYANGRQFDRRSVDPHRKAADRICRMVRQFAQENES